LPGVIVLVLVILISLFTHALGATSKAERNLCSSSDCKGKIVGLYKVNSWMYSSVLWNYFDNNCYLPEFQMQGNSLLLTKNQSSSATRISLRGRQGIGKKNPKKPQKKTN